ncbi:MAG: hypothetical protein U0573_10640 [Phycisphaerales bacterium]|nr:hypothetical protein [Planctomycetota bacterium]
MRPIRFSGLIVSLGAAVGVGLRPADGAFYTLDSVYAGAYAITTIFPDEDRFVYSWTDPASLNQHLYADTYAGTGSVTADTTLTYSATSNKISGSGSSAVHIKQGDVWELQGQSESFIQIFFTVTAPTLYQFDVHTNYSLFPGTTSAQVTFVNRCIGVNYGSGASGFGGASGLLSPGQYFITCQSKLIYDTIPPFNTPLVDSTSSYSFDLTLTPLPTPSTAWLGGLLVVAGRRRR